MPIRVGDLARFTLDLVARLTFSGVDEAGSDEVGLVVQRASIGDGERGIVDGAEGTPDVNELGCVGKRSAEVTGERKRKGNAHRPRSKRSASSPA